MDGSRNLTDDPRVQGTPRWRKAAVFAAEPEAELARQQLETARIPVILMSDRTGIFGPGFVGSSHLGITVVVPADLLEEARELIQDLIDGFGGSIPTDPRV